MPVKAGEISCSKQGPIMYITDHWFLLCKRSFTTRQDQHEGNLVVEDVEFSQGHLPQKNEWLKKIAYGGFLKWGYPQIIHLNMIFHYKPTILGYSHLWNPHIMPKFVCQVALHLLAAKTILATLTFRDQYSKQQVPVSSLKSLGNNSSFQAKASDKCCNVERYDGDFDLSNVPMKSCWVCLKF